MSIAAQLPATDAKLQGIIDRLAASLTSRLQNPDGSAVAIPVVAPSFVAKPDGSPVNGDWTADGRVGAGTAVGDVIWSIDTTHAQSILWYFLTTYGTGASFQIEVTANGQDWKNTFPYVRLDGIFAYTSGVASPAGNIFGMNTAGVIGVRMVLTAAPAAGGVVASFVRTIGNPLPPSMGERRTSIGIITSTTAIGAATGFTITSRQSYLHGLTLHNLVASDRFLALSNGSTYVTPPALIGVYRVRAGQDLIKSFPIGLGGVAGQISGKVFTDAALTTAAATGDVIGSVEFSA
jgi:hypothetical protein